MVDGFHDAQLDRRAAPDLGDDVAGRAGIVQRSTARCALLRVAQLVLDQPGCRFEQNEVRVG
jgi:hypothetical protein